MYILYLFVHNMAKIFWLFKTLQTQMIIQVGDAGTVSYCYRCQVLEQLGHNYKYLVQYGFMMSL